MLSCIVVVDNASYFGETAIDYDDDEWKEQKIIRHSESHLRKMSPNNPSNEISRLANEWS